MRSANLNSSTARPARIAVPRRRVPHRRGAVGALAIGTISVLALIAAWQIASMRLSSVLFPPPAKAFTAWWEMARDGSLLINTQASLARILIGFLAGVVVGVPLGLAMGLFTPVMIVFEPYVQFFRFVPPVAWLVPAILWFGIGELSKIFLIFYATVFLVVVNTMAGVRTVPRNQRWAASTFELNKWQLFAWVTLPATLPHVLTGMRIAIANSFAAVVGAELIAANVGLGYLIAHSAEWLAADRMFAGMLTLGALGFLADLAFRWAVRRYARRYYMTG